MIGDPWHFRARRIHRAHSYPARPRTGAGPDPVRSSRRTGKTEFLLKDLAPLAEDEGHRVIYASFWQAPLSPLAVLLHALETSLRQGSFVDRVRSSAAALAPRLKLSAPAARRRGGGRSRSHHPGGEAAGRAVAPSRRSPGARLRAAQGHDPASGRSPGACPRPGERILGGRAENQPRQASRAAEGGVHRVESGGARGHVLRTSGPLLPLRDPDRAPRSRRAVRRSSPRYLREGVAADAEAERNALRLRAAARQSVLLPGAGRDDAARPGSHRRLRSRTGPGPSCRRSRLSGDLACVDRHPARGSRKPWPTARYDRSVSPSAAPWALLSGRPHRRPGASRPRCEGWNDSGSPTPKPVAGCSPTPSSRPGSGRTARGHPENRVPSSTGQRSYTSPVSNAWRSPCRVHFGALLRADTPPTALAI